MHIEISQEVKLPREGMHLASVGIFLIYLHIFFPHIDIFPKKIKMTPDKTVQLLMKKIHFLTLGDGCLFPVIRTSCSRELFAVISCSRGNCQPLGIALSNLRTVSKAALPITCFF